MSDNIVPLTPRPTTATTSSRDQPGAVLRMTERAVYTVREVSELLSISLGGTYQLCRDRQIPALKLGGRWIIPKSRFHTWLDNLPTANPEED
ncbi:MAG: helix-turn-helix domain-containing protein [Pseudonocardiaceae bacterium]